MNTDYSQIVKEQRDSFDYNDLLSRADLTPQEVRLANGEQYFRLIYLLLVANGMIFAFRKNKASCWKFTLASLLGSYPIAYYTCKYMLGYDKLRRISKIQKDTYNSAKYYEQEVINKH